MRWVVAALCVALGSRAMADELPVPPIPPALPPSSTAAPMPDNSFSPPQAEASTGPSVALKFYHSRDFDPGMGFAPGSRYRANEDRRPLPAPGFTVRVPLN